MDSLILTFNKKQMNLYKELLEKESVALNFDTKLTPIQEYSFDVLDIEVINIKTQMVKITKFKKQRAMFSEFSQEQIKVLIPIYYEVIRNINYSRKILQSEMISLSCLILSIDKLISDINKKYSAFLPYKAALYNRDEYSSQILKIDEEFKANIKIAENCKKSTLSYFDKMINLSDIISNFFDNSSKASDEPKFKNFNYADFFWSVDSFIEQLNNI